MANARATPLLTRTTAIYRPYDTELSLDLSRAVRRVLEYQHNRSSSGLLVTLARSLARQTPNLSDNLNTKLTISLYASYAMRVYTPIKHSGSQSYNTRLSERVHSHTSPYDKARA
ncbi:hypothetical protein Tco_0840942 [Tanacetum coccineum]|uniref:Uncharacterized protein n=1 Tax=Tanacetum coccineum TaxID=301880 RepID=A0ABQ5AVC5_9ASTR